MASTLSSYELPVNVVGGASIPLSAALIPLATIPYKISENGLVLLRGSVGWSISATQQGQNQVTVLFKIWRGAPFTGALIYSIRDSGESWADKNKVTSFTHVDGGFTETKETSYTLTAELPYGGSANVVGLLTFTGSDLTLY